MVCRSASSQPCTTVIDKDARRMLPCRRRSQQEGGAVCASCVRSVPAMLHVCRRSLRNVLGQGGTKRDAAGYRVQAILGGYEVRARFC